ncbi:hypothetical protein [Streptococcus merionis]|uniref:Uncharacterized protein n=1 Tax=Streptococcus merionis TaxID=400065 RepID=A0A239SS79_9STRE|nr:hypothetical protein [Streptococcus merionis]SNU88102.1 Uncharacterised protein [Streptococcus merionis]
MNQKKRTLQELRRERARRRDKRVLIALSSLLALLLAAYLVSHSPELRLPRLSFSLPKWSSNLFQSTKGAEQSQKKTIQGKFAKGQQVIITPEGIESNDTLSPYRNRLARIESFSSQKSGEKESIAYTLNFGHGDIVDGISEEVLSEMATSFALNQEVELLDRTGAARVETIFKEGDHEIYSVKLEDGSVVDQLSFQQLAYVYDLPLKAANLPQDNNRLIQEAMDLSSHYSFVVIRFPKGRYRIGSQIPESEYILLRSNVELRGQETELVVEGAARWFGLATGPTGYDGVSHFLMNGLHFTASDLVNGNQFIIMTNHGYGWQIENNRFTMVHKMSSHIFDLGGLQESTFTNNTFEGYAPNLTNETEIGERDLHNFYSEAIQLDSSSNQTGWDGGMMRAIDPNYDWTSSIPIMTNHITISHNQFLPYYNAEGKVVAYGATVGQHSSKVGMVSIYGNTFKETLATRFKDKSPENWFLEPIHLQSEMLVDIRDNTYQ